MTAGGARSRSARSRRPVRARRQVMAAGGRGGGGGGGSSRPRSAAGDGRRVGFRAGASPSPSPSFPSSLPPRPFTANLTSATVGT